MRLDLNGGNEEYEKNGEPPSVSKALRRLRRRGGLLSRELCYAIEVANENPEGFRDYMQVRLAKTVRYMEQGNHVVSVMASAAPLLGLLGTVTGMVSTFEVITLYGNQNPVLMADGISEALISTQSGLLVAFPLTLLKQRLDERVEILRQKMELGATVQKDMGIEMGPLMDIVFILLIFFVVTSSFTRETGVDVTKPQAQSASQLEKENLLIAITREGTIHMNERQVDLASLQDILKQSLAKAPDREAVVIADKGAETGVLVQVIDMCNLAGVKKVSIAAQAE